MSSFVHRIIQKALEADHYHYMIITLRDEA